MLGVHDMYRVGYKTLPVSLCSTVCCSISRAISDGDIITAKFTIESLKL
jgi:hypothetical protein